MKVLFLNNYTPEKPGWYPAGQRRLKESAGLVSAPLLAMNEWPDGQRESKYAIKAETFLHAFDLYPEIDMFFWLDCSAWFARYPTQMIAQCREHGYFSIDNSGYNLAQTCNDTSLAIAGINRGYAEQWPDVSSMVMGFDVSHAVGRALRDQWVLYYYKGVFEGSREHDGQSNDPRFMFHRQDQSAWGLAHMELNLEPTSKWGEIVSITPKKQRMNVEIYAEGM